MSRQQASADTQQRHVGASRAGGFLLLFALGLATLLILLALLRQLGLPDWLLDPLVLALPLAATVAAALLAPARGGARFHLAGHTAGGALGALSAAAAAAVVPSFVGLGVSTFEAGYDGLSGGLGLSLGLALFAVVAAPLIRASGVASFSELIAARFGRPLGALLSLFAALLMLLGLAAALSAIATVAAEVAGLGPAPAIAAAALVLLALTLPGGARSLTAAQAVSGVVVIAAVLLVATLLAWQRQGSLLPMLSYGDALSAIDKLEIGLIGRKLADTATLKRHTAVYITTDALNFLGTVVTIALGVCALPPLATRAALAPTPQSARGVAAGTLLALLPLIVLLPAIAAYLRLDVLSLVAQPTPVDKLPGFIFDLGRGGAVKVCSAPAVSQDAVTAACAALSGHKGLLRLQDLRIEPELAFLAAPAFARLPPFIAAFAAAGLLAALLSFAAAAAWSAAGSLVGALTSQPGAFATRIMVVLTVFAAATIAVVAPAEPVRLVPWILPLAASALLPPFVLAFWWRRATASGIALGTLLGTALTLYYLAGTTYFPARFYETWPALSTASATAVRKFALLKTAAEVATAGPAKSATLAALDVHAAGLANWLGLRAPAAGLLGAPLSLLVAVLASLLTRSPAPAALAVTERARSTAAAPDAVHAGDAGATLPAGR